MNVTWELWVPSLGQEDPLEKEMTTHSSTLAWKIPWKEESGGLQAMRPKKESDMTEHASPLLLLLGVCVLNACLGWSSVSSVKKSNMWHL